MEFIFLQADKHQSIYNLVLSLWEWAGMSKVLKILQISLEKNTDEFCFLYADKHESVLQVDTSILGVLGPTKIYFCNKTF